MVKCSKKVIIGSILFATNILWLLFIIFFGKNLYLYPRFEFQFIIFVLNFTTVIIGDLIIFGLLFLMRKESGFVKVFFVILIVPLICYITIAIGGICGTGMFWHSETTEIKTFNEVDSPLNDTLTIADMQISDIINLDIKKSENFKYYCQRNIFGISFNFSGNFVFSEESYNYLKEKFYSSEDFDYKLFEKEKQEETSFTGCFELNVPHTFIDWENIEIFFSDSEKKFSFSLSGFYDT